jgi:hypothetical protein
MLKRLQKTLMNTLKLCPMKPKNQFITWLIFFKMKLISSSKLSKKVNLNSIITEKRSCSVKTLKKWKEFMKWETQWRLDNNSLKELKTWSLMLFRDLLLVKVLILKQTNTTPLHQYPRFLRLLLTFMKWKLMVKRIHLFKV